MIIEEVFKKNYKSVLKFAKYKTNNPFDAEDVVSEAFITLIRKKDILVGDDFKPWLCKTSYNHFRVLLKRPFSRREIFNINEREIPVENDINGNIYKRQLQSAIKEFALNLTDKEYQIFIAFFLKKERREDIAKSLKISIRTTGRTISRLKSELKKFLIEKDITL